ncbi:MAG TPA: uracil-DNA glycosylase family protein [Gammaproteobacteria bacterium]|nr:uracil-DNA glycosylase family protein [Gammaproteobacteria bacterium]
MPAKSKLGPRSEAGASELVRIDRELAARLEPLSFAPPVCCTYNPLVYAREPHEAYLNRYGAAAPREVLLVGMNPGPFGMVQTGVPFGDVVMAREWLRVTGRVSHAGAEHPKRPVLGFACRRREVSGSRLWGWARARYGDADSFFARFFVANYCPLAFVEESGRNRTPDKLPAEERQALFAACDDALRAVVLYFAPRFVIGIGGFAERRLREALTDCRCRIGTILHPSPASPLANRGWPEVIERQLESLGIEL